MEALHETTMILTDEEIRWALDIKNAALEMAATAAEEDDDNPLVILSDYEYAHYALVTRGNVEESLQKMEMMQYFRQEYGIQDTLEDGMEILVKLTRTLQPWFMVSVDYNATEGHFIVVYDYAKLTPSAVNYPQDWRVWLGGLYYIFQLTQCNLEACRQGLVHICECEGMWKDNFNVDFMSQNWTHLMEHYPLINKECSWLHTPLVGNLQHAFYKSLMGSFADVIRVGCDFDGYDGRVDEMFKTPNLEVAEQRLLTRYMTYLRVRYHHQTVFRLPTTTTPTVTNALIPPDPPAAAARPPVPMVDRDDNPHYNNDTSDDDGDDQEEDYEDLEEEEDLDDNYDGDDDDDEYY